MKNLNKTLQLNEFNRNNLWDTLYTRRYFLGFCAYFIFLFVIAPFQARHFDSFYYWDWSRHLDLSYFDGPPFIAYLIKLFTLLLGDTLFALASVSIFSTLFSCYVLYQTARLLFPKYASYEVVLFWVFAPITTLDLLRQTTYDNPSTFFWILSLYFCVRFIQENHVKYLYFVGISIGFLILSKYTGIILILGLMFFLLTTPYRRLFKNIHFYAALGLSLLIISPIFIWNYQHQWISFTYQLSNHIKSGHTILFFLGNFFCYINGMLIPLWVAIKYSESTKAKQMRFAVQFSLSICLCFFLFYLFFSFKSEIKPCWLQPFLITSALLIPFWQHPFKKRLLMVYIICSMMIILNSAFQFNKSIHFYELAVIQSINQHYSPLPKTVVTTNWLIARNLFFLKNKPTIYALECDQSARNQYLLWSQNLNATLRHKKDFLFIGHVGEEACLKQYNFDCKLWISEANLVTYYCTA